MTHVKHDFIVKILIYVLNNLARVLFIMFVKGSGRATLVAKL